MQHWSEGIELDVKYLEKMLPYIHQLWGRPVHMETMIEERTMLFTYDGKGIHRKYI
jgi:stage V sporulation protein R